MYSVVLMMAMTGAPETPSFGHCWWKHSCYSSCYGCCGGYGFGWPGYTSYACSGCAGNVTSYHSCIGYAPNYWAPFSCFGYGAYGGTSYTWPYPADPNMTTGYGYGYPIPPNSIPRVDKDDGKKIEKKIDTKPLPSKDMMIYPNAPSNRAQVVVRLPADAKLFANNQLTNLASAERSFSTPVLERGFDYQYEMKIEYTRDGKTITDKRMVQIRAGEISQIEFVDRAKGETVTSAIKFVAPAGAKLFVDGKPLAADAPPAYQTPALVQGAEYVYVVRAELDRDGKTETQTQRIVFKAGEAVTVDFMELGGIRTAAK